MSAVEDSVKQILPNTLTHLEDLFVFVAHDVQRKTGKPIYLLSDQVTAKDASGNIDWRKTNRNQARNRRRARHEQQQHPEWIVVCSSNVMSKRVRRNLFPSSYEERVAMWPNMMERGAINGIIAGPKAHLSEGSLAEQAKARKLGLPVVPASELPPTFFEQVSLTISSVK